MDVISEEIMVNGKALDNIYDIYFVPSRIKGH